MEGTDCRDTNLLVCRPPSAASERNAQQIRRGLQPIQKINSSVWLLISNASNRCPNLTRICEKNKANKKNQPNTITCLLPYINYKLRFDLGLNIRLVTRILRIIITDHILFFLTSLIFFVFTSLKVHVYNKNDLFIAFSLIKLCFIN